MIDKLNKVIEEKSEKIMTNPKVEGMVNSLRWVAVLCWRRCVRHYVYRLRREPDEDG